MFRTTLSLPTPGRGLHDVTDAVAQQVSASGVRDGLVHLFLQHTSASLLVQENADADVLHDLDAWFGRAVPDGDPRYRHTAEGPDDMPSHIRAALTATSLLLPIVAGRLALGTWQAVYLFEHRTKPHTRRIVLTAW
ncbi:MAG: secondary thiamine-phosphate synthase enzyme YjbQ [Myxococcota bacterium]